MSRERSDDLDFVVISFVMFGIFFIKSDYGVMGLGDKNTLTDKLVNFLWFFSTNTFVLINVVIYLRQCRLGGLLNRNSSLPGLSINQDLTFLTVKGRIFYNFEKCISVTLTSWVKSCNKSA